MTYWKSCKGSYILITRYKGMKKIITQSFNQSVLVDRVSASLQCPPCPGEGACHCFSTEFRNTMDNSTHMMHILYAGLALKRLPLLVYPPLSLH